jgi:hypothetical protein
MTETILFGILVIGAYLELVLVIWCLSFSLCPMPSAPSYLVPNRYCVALTNPMGPVIIVFPPGAA